MATLIILSNIKAMVIGSTNYSDDFIKSFPNEAEFMKVAVPMFGKSKEELHGVYQSVVPTVIAPKIAEPVIEVRQMKADIAPTPPPIEPETEEASEQSHEMHE